MFLCILCIFDIEIFYRHNTDKYNEEDELNKKLRIDRFKNVKTNHLAILSIRQS